MKTGKIDRFEAVDLTQYQLPKDEPLSSSVIEMHQKLALAVLTQAIDDLGSRDDVERQLAERFCLSDNSDYHALRMLWLGWIGMSEETFARAAITRMKWLAKAAA